MRRKGDFRSGGILARCGAARELGWRRNRGKFGTRRGGRGSSLFMGAWGRGASQYGRIEADVDSMAGVRLGDKRKGKAPMSGPELSEG